MDKVRIDKWLWAARFFKTRSLAAEAVSGGKIKLNGVRPKPSKDVKIGAEIIISHGPIEKTVEVKGLSDKRGPAKEAVLLYEELPESIERREAMSQMLKMDALTRPKTDTRPNKRERRKLTSFKKGG